MAFNPMSALIGAKVGQMNNPFNILSNSIQNGANAGNALMKLLYGPQMYNDTHNAAVANLAAQNIKNQYMPQSLQDKNKLLTFKANNPELSAPGIPGLMAWAKYLDTQNQQPPAHQGNVITVPPGHAQQQSAAINTLPVQQTQQLQQQDNNTPAPPALLRLLPNMQNGSPNSNLNPMQANGLQQLHQPQVPQQTTQQQQPSTPNMPQQKQSIGEYVDSFNQNAKKGMYPGSALPELKNATPLMQAIYNSQRQKLNQVGYGQASQRMAMWRYMPANEKTNMMAIAAGYGIPYGKAAQYFLNGGSLDDLAKQSGIPLSQINPIYPSDKTAIRQIQLRGMALKGVEVLNDTVTNWLAPYSVKAGDVSPKLLMQQIQGKNPDDQAKAIAGAMLAPEIAAGRLRVMQGQTGQKLMDELQSKSLMNLKPFQLLVTPDVYRKAQSYVTNLIGKVFSAEKASITNPYGKDNAVNSSQSKNSSNNGYTLMTDANGNHYRIPVANVGKAKNRGLTEVQGG